MKLLPMNEAPKDGERILGYTLFNGDGRPRVALGLAYPFAVVWCAHTKLWRLDNGRCPYEDPTHWQPFPEAHI